jgi:hypothetical protein
MRSPQPPVVLPVDTRFAARVVLKCGLLKKRIAMNSQKSFADVAAIQILAHEILYEIGMPASGDVASRISARIEEVVGQFVGSERERCAQLCKKRASLWSKTTMASMPLGREESRARANEASYLADLITSE